MNMPELDDMATDVGTLNLLFHLTRFEAPKVAVEAGTYRGHGALSIAGAMWEFGLPGHVWTADPDDAFSAFLRGHPLEPFITFRPVRFEEMLAEVPSPIDLAFIDATGPVDGSMNLRVVHLQLVLPRMRPGGLILVHDTGGQVGDWAGREVIRQAGGVNLSGPRGLTLIQARP